MKTNKSLILAVFAMIAPMTISHAETNDGNEEATVAVFDYFTYSGNDDVYTQYPLKSATSYYNPILPGWNSDPSICRVGNDYYMVTSTFAYYPGVPLFHSRDLVNWRQTGYVLDRPSQLPLEGQGVSQGIFAPSISYNPKNKTFYMITTNVGWGNFFVKTKNPLGEWSEPILLPDVHGIDPSFFFDDDGKAYIVNNDEPEGTPEYEGHRAIKLHEFDVENDKTIGQEKVIVDKGTRPEDKPIWIEGPHLYKIGGKYYLMAAEGGTSDMHSEVIFTSDSPSGPFVPAEQNPILTQRHLPVDRPYPVTCAGHADLVQTPQGEWYAVFLACRPNEEKFENLGRETFLMPVRWNDDGTPYITKDNESVPMTGNVTNATRGNNVTFGNFSYKDDFTDKKLSVEWLSLRGPADPFYSLTASPGYLTMKCIDVGLHEKKVPAFIARRVCHHKFECETRLAFEPQNVGEKAGLTLFKDEMHHYTLCIVKTDNGKEIELAKIGEDGNSETIAKSAIEDRNNDFRLKVVSNGIDFDFHFAVADGEWQTLAEDIDARYLSTANAWGFTGTTIGLHASSK